MGKKRAGGRPSPYNENMNTIAFSFAAMHCTDREIAENMGISEVTLNAWKKKHSGFLKSLEEGKKAVDDDVEKSLYLLAKGYEREIEQITKSGEVVTVKVYYPPQVRACEFWLINRRRKEWTNKQEVVNTNLNLEVPVDEADKAWVKANMQAMFPGLKIDT